MNSAQQSLPTFEDVRSAARLLKGVAVRTPVLTNEWLDKALDAQVFFKVEALQRTGAFKIRGAYNAVANLDEDAKKRGVVTFSSGNHGQAVAIAGRLLGVPATVFMPLDAPAIKRAATARQGARIIDYDRLTQNRDELARSFAQQTGATLIPPFDHAHVMAGQGTAAMELIEDVGELDVLVVCLGGGGLISGCSLAAKALSPNCEVYGVEPENGDDVRQSLRAGERIAIEHVDSIADGALTTQVGVLPFAVIQKNVTDIVTVSDTQLIDTMLWFAENLKVVVEPTGALATAALMHGKIPYAPGARIGLIVSGGNVDPDNYGPWLAQAKARQGAAS